MRAASLQPPGGGSRRPTVSVAMATFNGERFLAEQLQSLATQARMPDELVICDDGSTDGTVAVIEAFSRSAPFPVTFVRNEIRLGHTRNFLRAASLCESDFVAFCDQDDVWLAEKLERCVSLLTGGDGPSLVAHAAEAVNDELIPLGYRDPDIRSDRRFSPGQGLPNHHYLGFTLCFERALLSLIPSSYLPVIPRFEHQPGHDHWICFLAGLRSGTHLISEPLVLYRQHGANTVGGERRHDRRTLASAISADADSFMLQAQDTERWAAIVEDARRRGDLSPEAFASESWVNVHRDVARALRTRAGLHGQMVSAGRRWAMLRRLLWTRSYRPRWRGGLGHRAALKDVAVCLMGRERLDGMRRESRRFARRWAIHVRGVR
jgi:rhamnosyltransferase